MNEVDKTGGVLKVACLQMNSSADVAENLMFIENVMSAARPLDILALPENFAQMPENRHTQHVEMAGHGNVQTFLHDLARRYQIHIVAGSLPIKSHPKLADDHDGASMCGKPYARCLIIAPNGEVSHYDKLHLFDVDVEHQGDRNSNQTKRQRYRESDTYQQGKLGGQQLAPHALQIGSTTVRLGASICYDLRFPELYRGFASQGVDLITVPSAFTYDTGKAHWECLLRARAIENQAFVMAPAQVGVHANGRKTWGHSMIIDPWGTVLAAQTAGTGLLYADLDLHLTQRLKKTFPVLTHKRIVDGH